jgi:hypothetical protein
MTVTEDDGILGMSYYRVGGHLYARQFKAGCRVCASPYRAEAEIAIAAGQHYTNIVENLPEDANLKATHLSAHFRSNHMPLRQAAVRRIIDDRASELGHAIEEGVDQIADHVALARVVVQRSFQGIADGTLEPTVADGIAAAKILQQSGVNDEEVDKAVYVEAFIQYMQTAQQIMNPEQFVAFGQSLSKNQTLRALVTRYQQGQTQQEAIS